MGQAKYKSVFLRLNTFLLFVLKSIEINRCLYLVVVRRSKSKCGATVRWLVGGVAPLLILLKRWLVCSFFVSQFDCCTVANRMTANGWVYETFGISKRFPIKPLRCLLSVPPLKLALSAKCFIYRVVF